VRGMRERDGTHWAMLGKVEGVSPLETFICATCGYTAWYSGAAGSLKLQRVFDPKLRCVECGGYELHVEEMSEWPNDGRLTRRPLGMTILVCACGRCEWVRGFGALGDAPVADAQPCVRCLDDQGKSVFALFEDGARPLPVAVVDKFGVGRFELRWCSSCSLCEWFARDLDGLRDDGKHVIFMAGEKRPGELVAKGPYR
jgi:hypothetical protein